MRHAQKYSAPSGRPFKAYLFFIKPFVAAKTTQQQQVVYFLPVSFVTIQQLPTGTFELTFIIRQYGNYQHQYPGL
jgi:hypothetical protein